MGNFKAERILYRHKYNTKKHSFLKGYSACLQFLGYISECHADAKVRLSFDATTTRTEAGEKTFQGHSFH
jgi:hypothetical protein